jgi:hypothetical protein
MKKEDEYPFKVGQRVRLLSDKSSCEYGKFNLGTTPGDIVTIKGISFEGGDANENDPRYYGDNFNVRAKDLEAIDEKRSIPNKYSTQGERMEYAKKNYPVGTRYCPAHIDKEKDVVCIISNDKLYESGDFNIMESAGNSMKNGHDCTELVYYYKTDKWAEIITDSPKPIVLKDGQTDSTKTRFKSGDIVNIINKYRCYTTYFDAFKWFGFNNTTINSINDIQDNDRPWTVVKCGTEGLIYETLVMIQDGNIQLLIHEEGLLLVNRISPIKRVDDIPKK